MPTLAHFTHRRRLPRLWTKVVGQCVSAARSTSFGLRVDKDDKRMAIRRTADIGAKRTFGKMAMSV
jgi:hypothetical protein